MIPKDSEDAETLIRYTKMDNRWRWVVEQHVAIEQIFTTYMTVCILPHCDHDGEALTESAAADYVSVDVRLQHHTDRVLYCVAYLSSTSTAAECNYVIHTMELIAIIDAFEEL